MSSVERAGVLKLVLQLYPSQKLEKNTKEKVDFDVRSYKCSLLSIKGVDSHTCLGCILNYVHLFTGKESIP